jgi:hypothetical protein
MKTIPLTQGYVALVDDDNYERLAKYRWCAAVRATKNRTAVYAIRNHQNADGGRTTVLMHREIIPGSKYVDHWDRNGLNNQKSNLRRASQAQNNANQIKARGSSSFKGVSWDNRRDKWRAHLMVSGKFIHLGTFKEEVDAATVYNLAAYSAFGEFSLPNVPLEVACLG